MKCGRDLVGNPFGAFPMHVPCEGELETVLSASGAPIAERCPRCQATRAPGSKWPEPAREENNCPAWHVCDADCSECPL